MRKAFFDTNILAYACDLDSPSKLARSRSLLREASQGLCACISTQVIQELYVTATRKLSIEPLHAKDIIQSLKHVETVVISPEDIGRAIDGNILWTVSFWDALILVAAQKAKCEVLYTEDLCHGQVIEGVHICNPFLNE